ncbi:hypothetical protein ACFX1X_027012 [Malus domestica]
MVSEQAQWPHVLHITPLCCPRVRLENSPHVRRGVLRMNPTLMRRRTLHVLMNNWTTPHITNLFLVSNSCLESNSESSWGNKFGMFLLPIYYHKSSDLDPLVYLKRAKLVLDRKKQSLEADFSYKVGCFLITYFGAKVASWLLYKMVCNTSFTISNILGPQEEIAIGGNLVTYLKVNTCSLPQALTMHMVSYAERADLQILVAKDIIPDPTFLAKCFEEALLDMKEAASSHE